MCRARNLSDAHAIISRYVMNRIGVYSAAAAAAAAAAAGMLLPMTFVLC